MRLDIADEYREFLMLICLFKVYYDAGIYVFDKIYSNDVINDYDYFYEYILEAVQCAAPIVVNDEKLYKKYIVDEYYDDTNVWAYSSKEMQEYYKIARKLNILKGNSPGENKYIDEIERKIESIRGFESYSFDYFIGNKRKGAQLEILWSYDFQCEIPMCLWIVRSMAIFREELPKIKEKYRKVHREKRVQRNCMRKGGTLSEAA